MQEHRLRQHLLDLVRRLEDSGGPSAQTVGKRALNDNTFFARLVARNNSFTVRTYDRVVTWLFENWPDGLEWPSDVPRPECVSERLA